MEFGEPGAEKVEKPACGGGEVAQQQGKVAFLLERRDRAAHAGGGVLQPDRRGSQAAFFDGADECRGGSMAKTCDLTSGSIPRHLLRLAAPLIMGNILQQLYNTMDTFILGRFAGELEFAAAVCMLYLKCRALELLFRREDRRMDRALLRQTAQFSFVTALHQSSLYIGKLLVQGAVNTGGTEMISAYTAMTRIEGFANSFGDSGSAATSVLVALFYVFCFTGNTFAGYFNGTGRVSVPFIGATSHIALRVVLSWLLVGKMGLPAVALATGLGWVTVNALWALIKRAADRRSAQA